MKNKAWSIIKKHHLIILLAAIFLLGVFLRTYHLGDWLHFELDQSRDAKVVDLALEDGIGNLPLLGPKAAGSFLRLGPIFYYFEYLSALIFGATPWGMIGLSCLFSCLTIPIFFLFIRKYFEKNLSLILTGIFSASLFFVMYSRFGWNPNNLPFFTLLSFLSLLNLSDPNSKRRGFWLLVLALAIGITTQLHFVAFLAIPVITLLFLIWKRPRIFWTYWLSAILIIITLYIPLIINDVRTGGDNIQEFIRVFNKKTDSEKETHTFFEKIYKNTAENSLGYFLILSGEESYSLPKVETSSGKLEIICNTSCEQGRWGGRIALIFYLLGVFLLFFKTFLSFRNKSPESQKNFLVLGSLWFLVSWIIFFPIAFDLAPRFFLLISALPFIFLGLILEKIKGLIQNKKIALLTIWIIGIFFIVSNLLSIKERFWQLQNAPQASFKIAPDRVLKENVRVTLEQQYLIVDYMLGYYEKNNYPIYLNSDAYFRRSFLYHLDKKEIPRDDFRNASNSKNIYSQGNYFLIYQTSANWNSKTNKYLPDFEVAEKKTFGTLTAWHLIPKPASINAVRQEFEPKGKPKSAPGVPVRYRWEEIFNDTAEDEKTIENTN